MERLRLQRRVNTSRKAESGLVPVSSNERISEEDLIEIVNKLRTPNTHVNPLRFLHNKSQSTFTSNEIRAQEETSKSSEEKQITQGTEPSHSRTPRPLGVIYSTTDDDDNNENDHQHCTTVKSSTELLTTVMNADDYYSAEKQISQDRQSSRDASDDELMHKTVLRLDEKTASDLNNNSIILNKSNGSSDQDIDDSIATNGNSYSDEDISDIADALTQVIEEYSVEELNLVNNKDEGSVDEELMSETVKEIRDDLMSGISVENIILTPPFGYRD